MTLNEYQEQAMSTCMKSCENDAYMMLNLVGEVGELASKLAKDIRKDKAAIQENYLVIYEDEYMWMRYKEYMKEAGDILWQLAGLCKIFGWTLEQVAQVNLDKLASRKERGVIDGNGDNR